MGTCVPLTLVSPGRITKHSCMVSGWFERNFLGQQDKNRSCPHHIREEETTTGAPPGIALPLTRIVDSVLQHVPAGITRGSSASALESLVICRVVAKDGTLPYLLNRRVGTYNLTTCIHATETTVRETLHRPGHHPHRSIRISFGPLVIFIHQIDLINSVTGY